MYIIPLLDGVVVIVVVKGMDAGNFDLMIICVVMSM